jgi:hypothetical protein
MHAVAQIREALELHAMATSALSPGESLRLEGLLEIAARVERNLRSRAHAGRGKPPTETAEMCAEAADLVARLVATLRFALSPAAPAERSPS